MQTSDGAQLKQETFTKSDLKLMHGMMNFSIDEVTIPRKSMRIFHYSGTSKFIQV